MTMPDLVAERDFSPQVKRWLERQRNRDFHALMLSAGSDADRRNAALRLNVAGRYVASCRKRQRTMHFCSLHFCLWSNVPRRLLPLIMPRLSLPGVRCLI